MVLAIKNLSANAEDEGAVGLIPGLGRSPGGRQDNLLQYACLEDPTVRGAWRATARGVSKSQTGLKQRGTHACTQRQSMKDLDSGQKVNISLWVLRQGSSSKAVTAFREKNR